MSTSLRHEGGPPLEIDATLAEEAVYLALRDNLGHPYWQKRNEAYEQTRPDQRSGHFVELNRKAFGDLEFDLPLKKAIAEQPLVHGSISLCRVMPAGKARNVGAELFVADQASDSKGPTKNLVIRLEPGSFGDPVELLRLLRRELWYIHDMLDPEFHYDPRLPEAEGGPMHVTLILRRYRVLWSTVVHGRLAQAGQTDSSDREQCFRQFASTFGMFEQRVEDAFTKWFECLKPRHDELLQFARDPLVQFQGRDERPTSVAICPLCLCPGTIDSSEPKPADLGLLREMQHDFPHWTPALGACSQCFELYRGRLVHQDVYTQPPTPTR